MAMNELTTDIQAVAQRETALYEAMLAFDYAALDGLLSDDLSYVHSTGVVESKPEYLSALRRGLYEYAAITKVGSSTRLFADIAITSGVIDMLVGAQGSAKGTIRLQHVLVWVRELGTWRLLLHQATRIPA
jgi:hypothetical protein